MRQPGEPRPVAGVAGRIAIGRGTVRSSLDGTEPPAQREPPTGDGQASGVVGAAAGSGTRRLPAATETIDSTGTTHLAAQCDEDDIRLASSADGSHWTSRTFRPPTGRMLSGPEIAFDGNRLTVAYTRLAPAPQDEGCGDVIPVDVGVYVRTRSLPDGSWSAEQKVGETADSLMALRTANGLRAVIGDKAGRVFYETLIDGRLTRQRIPGATGGASLRIGDDGRPRVAFEAKDGIRLGTFDGGTFRSELIPGSAAGWGPALVLGPGMSPTSCGTGPTPAAAVPSPARTRRTEPTSRRTSGGRGRRRGSRRGWVRRR